MISLSSKLFTWRQVAGIGSIFLVATVAIQRLLRYVCSDLIAFDCPYYWPVSIMDVRMPSARDLVVAAVVAAAFFVAIRILEARRYELRSVIASAILLIAGLSFIHGVEVGFYAPIAGDAQTGVLMPYSLDGQEYYHDAIKVADARDFLARYNELQPTLNRHSHTHPPGAVLTLYALNRIFGDPALIAMAIMLIATPVSLYFVYRLMAAAVDDDTARYVTAIFAFLPVVQIYYLATLDALIAAILIAALYLFCFGSSRGSAAAAAVLVSTSFFLTFVSLFILPVLVGFELLVKRSLKRSAIVVIGLVAFHVLLYWFTGYDAIRAFRTASAFENPRGFMLFVEPANYLFTRLEDIAEIVFFLGPFLLLLFFRGFSKLRERPHLILTLLGCATFAGMLVTGAFRTGETARACIFLYPFLLFPIAHYLDDSDVGDPERRQLVTLVFAQAVGMQLFGNYHW